MKRRDFSKYSLLLGMGAMAGCKPGSSGSTDEQAKKITSKLNTESLLDSILNRPGNCPQEISMW